MTDQTPDPVVFPHTWQMPDGELVYLRVDDVIRITSITEATITMTSPSSYRLDYLPRDTDGLSDDRVPL